MYLLVLCSVISLLIFFSFYFSNDAFGQNNKKIAGEPNSENLSIKNNKTTSNIGNDISNIVKQKKPEDFVSKGIINSVLTLSKTKWLATGDWKIILNNGNISLFEVKMTWYNNSGLNSHTHDLLNFKYSKNKPDISIQPSTKNTIIRGTIDVKTNNQTSWHSVPVTITIKNNTIINILIDDKTTNRHFAAQPILGIVNSFTPCSDVPGPNMKVLPPCTLDISKEIVKPLNQTFIAPKTFSLNKSQSSDSIFANKNRISVDNQDTECKKLKIINVKASGFETDPDDYHPPQDAIDGNSDTWWSNQNKKSWLKFDLGSQHSICGLSVQWNKGEERKYEFVISVSKDNNKFEQVFEGSNDKSDTAEDYDFDKTDGRYVMLATTGTSSEKGWVSINEAEVRGNLKIDNTFVSKFGQ